MKAWTIHSIEVWKAIQETGVLRCQEDQIDLLDFFRPSYDWLRVEMSKHIGAPPTSIKYPVWVWVRREGIKQPRPDLRFERQGWEKGEKGVMLECELDPKQVLLSDYDKWHCVLNKSYLPFDELDELAFDARFGRLAQFNPTPECYAAIVASWTRMFDVDAEADGDYWWKPEQRSIQGTVWEIRADQVVKVTPFTGNRRIQKAS